MKRQNLIYISYSHSDKQWHKELREILDRDDRIEVWDDTKIPSGANWLEEIESHVARTKVMVMLVSPDYLSPECQASELEIKPAIEAASRKEMNILWIPVRVSNFVVSFR